MVAGAPWLRLLLLPDAFEDLGLLRKHHPDHVLAGERLLDLVLRRWLPQGDLPLPAVFVAELAGIRRRRGNTRGSSPCARIQIGARPSTTRPPARTRALLRDLPVVLPAVVQ